MAEHAFPFARKAVAIGHSEEEIEKNRQVIDRLSREKKSERRVGGA